MAGNSSVVAPESLYQKIINEMAKYVPSAYIVTTNDIKKILGIDT